MAKKEKELSFKGKLEKDIFTILDNIKKQYDFVYCVDNSKHYKVEENIRYTDNYACEICVSVSVKPVDFRPYKEIIDALVKTVQLYYKNGFKNDKIKNQLKLESELINNTLSDSVQNGYMKQYNTLLNIANSLTDLLKFINSYDTNTKIEQMKNSISTKNEIKTSEELYIKDIENYIGLTMARNKVEEEIMKCLGTRYKEYYRCFLRECLEIEEVNDTDKISINANKIGTFLKDISQNIELIIK